MEKLLPLQSMILLKLPTTEVVKLNLVKNAYCTRHRSNHFLSTCEAQYVLVGIPEDIGIRANFGRPGAASAWDSALRSIANIQHNRFCKGSQIIVLGQINVTEEMIAVENLNFNDIKDRSKLSQLVEKIDKDVLIICNIIH
jgi:formiminoglutamase